METNADKVFKSIERKSRNGKLTCRCGSSEIDVVRLKPQKQSILEPCRCCGQTVGVDYPKYALRVVFICLNCEMKKPGYIYPIGEYTTYNVKMMLKKSIKTTKIGEP